ncbi:NUDIX hydrolase [Chloroflexi bacterium TSY]|nr:NUDIX hydrolase [Chloroflexi bacterium TSY]
MLFDRSSLPIITDEIKQTWYPRLRSRSAGGVAYEYRAPPHVNTSSGLSHVRIALIGTKGGTRWQLPKGTVEEKESSIQAAIREVEEEVGLQTNIQTFLKTIEYWYWDTYCKDVPHLVHKTVNFYLMKVVGGALSADSIEVDVVGWFTPERARQKLTFDDEQSVLELAISFLARFWGWFILGGQLGLHFCKEKRCLYFLI